MTSSFFHGIYLNSTELKPERILVSDNHKFDTNWAGYWRVYKFTTIIHSYELLQITGWSFCVVFNKETFLLATNVLNNLPDTFIECVPFSKSQEVCCHCYCTDTCYCSIALTIVQIVKGKVFWWAVCMITVLAVGQSKTKLFLSRN